MYYSIGFGPDMSDTDMIIWQAAGADSYVGDYYAYQQNTPMVDNNDLVWEAYPQNSSLQVEYDYVIFTTWRPLDTGEMFYDYVIPLGDEIPMCYAMLDTTSNLTYHKRRGVFRATFTDKMGPQVT